MRRLSLQKRAGLRLIAPFEALQSGPGGALQKAKILGKKRGKTYPSLSRNTGIGGNGNFGEYWRTAALRLERPSISLSTRFLSS